MSYTVTTIVEPFVKRGLFASPEQAVAEMAQDYVLRQIKRYQKIIQKLQTRYGTNLQTIRQKRAKVRHYERSLIH